MYQRYAIVAESDLRKAGDKLARLMKPEHATRNAKS
jgi:hypothetical protein